MRGAVCDRSLVTASCVLSLCPIWGAGDVCAGETAKVLLAEKGLARAVIALGPAPTTAERTAARELASYLEAITGVVRFAVVSENRIGPGRAALYVGDTAFARRQGIEVEHLTPEQWIVRTVDGSVVLAGGRPRGALYAVYHFLEDVLGVRWYAPTVEVVPSEPTLSVDATNLAGEPAFAGRDWSSGFPRWNLTWYGSPETKRNAALYMLRNRLNGSTVTHRSYWEVDGSRPWGKRFPPGRMALGGSTGLPEGGPHTFCNDLPPETYFKKHPEWFSMRNGKRVRPTYTNGQQLCLTNRAMREEYIRRFLAKVRAHPQFATFQVGMNDGGCKTPCDCPTCTAFMADSSPSDLYFDFINAVAAALREVHPGKRMRTLAYMFTVDPPKKVRILDTIDVVLCIPYTDIVRPRSAINDGVGYEEKIVPWRGACTSLHLWAYSLARLPYMSTVVFHWQDLFRYLQASGLVRSVFMQTEFDMNSYLGLPEFYPMNLWVLAKLMEDPSRDLDALLEDFLLGYYGTGAGRHMLAYLMAKKGRLAGYPHAMFDLAFAKQATQWFEKAEAAAKRSPVQLARVRDARIWLDVSLLAQKNALAREHVRGGGTMETFPFPQDKLGARVLSRLRTTEDYFWNLPSGHPKATRWKPIREVMRAYVECAAAGKPYVPLPEQFRHLAPDRVVEIPAPLIGGSGDARYVRDAQSPFGMAMARVGHTELPCPVQVYDYPTKETLGSAQVSPKMVTGPGYHLYGGFETTIGRECVVVITRSWRIGYGLIGNLRDGRRPKRKWRVYASMRFDGPDHPHGNPKAVNGVYVDRLILVAEQ